MPITQQQAIERGATHFIEQYRNKSDELHFKHSNIEDVQVLDFSLNYTIKCENLTTVSVFLIKEKKQ